MSADVNDTANPMADGATDQLVLTVDEVARLLRISRGLAFAAVRAGTLPHVRVGKRILIPSYALQAMLNTAVAPKPS